MQFSDARDGVSRDGVWWWVREWFAKPRGPVEVDGGEIRVERKADVEKRLEGS